MSGVLVARIVVAVAGIIVWAYGARYDLPAARWTGTAFIAAAMLLRFAGRRPARDHDFEPDDKQS